MYKFTNLLIQNHAKNTANHGVGRLYWLVQLKGESAKGNDMMKSRVTFEVLATQKISVSI